MAKIITIRPIEILLIIINSFSLSVAYNQSQLVASQQQQIVLQQQQIQALTIDLQKATNTLEGITSGFIDNKTIIAYEGASAANSLLTNTLNSLPSLKTLISIGGGLLFIYYCKKTIAGFTLLHYIPKLDIVGSLPFIVKTKHLNFDLGDFSFKLDIQGDTVTKLQGKHTDDPSYKSLDELCSTDHLHKLGEESPDIEKTQLLLTDKSEVLDTLPPSDQVIAADPIITAAGKSAAALDLASDVVLALGSF